MESYISGSVIPPLSEFCPLSETAAISEKGSDPRKRDRNPESSQKEREKREKMTKMFSLLQSMVPNLSPKSPREKIVTNTIEYIHRLEEERERLQNLKKSSSLEAAIARPTLCNITNRNFSINIAVSHAIRVFDIQSPVTRQCLLTAIFWVLAKHNAEVLAANVAVNKQQLKLTVTAIMANGGAVTAEKIRREILLL